MPHRKKIKDLEELAGILAERKKENMAVIHCHGVFDLLHIGHVRYFTEAKSMGDILVVTLTKDEFVNKGPGRPVFDQDLRSETIASLDSVDYVAINKWPVAVETIKLLKPDYYVKGPDYRDAEMDRTGGIRLEAEAVESVGGKIAFTKDITFSSSSLLNKHFSGFPKETQEYIEGFKSRFTVDDIAKWVESCSSLKVLVVGEAIIDEYQYCEAIGKSSKEPTLVVKSGESEKFAGGILAVANHVAGFSDNVGMITLLGSENTQEKFIENKLNPEVNRMFLYRDGSPTIVKRRFIESYFFSKLFEVYEYNDENISNEDNDKLCALLEKEIPGYDVVIVVDYGHSMITNDAVKVLCEKSKFLVINAQANAGNLGYNRISKYPRADLVSTAEKEIRLEALDHRADIEKIIHAVNEKMDYGQIIITRGNRGSLCFSRQDGFVTVPALAQKIVDRIGAGDAFLSIASLIAARKAPLELAAFIGNAAGAQAVAMVGNKEPVRRTSLIRHIETLLK